MFLCLINNTRNRSYLFGYGLTTSSPYGYGDLREGHPNNITKEKILFFYNC